MLETNDRRLGGKTKSILIHGLVIAFIAFISLFKLSDYKMLVILDDEFGYWSNAELLLRGNWLDLAQHTPYYSMGYSLFLLPILYFFKSYETAYRAALVLNAVFMVIDYFCAYYIVSSFSRGKTRDHILVLESLVAVLCCSNIYYTKTGLCETLVVTLFWVIAALFVSLEKSFSYVKLCGILIVAVYAYYTHQRYMGVLFALAAALLILLISKKRPIPILLVAFFIFFAFESQKYVRDFQNLLLANARVTTVNEVTVNGELVGGKLQKLLSNFPIFLESVGGKIYATFVYSFGAFFAGLWAFGQKIFNRIKKKEKSVYFISEIFFVICIIVMVGLSSVQMMGYSRKEIVVYTRYMEFAFGPFFILSLDYLIRNIKDKLVFAIYIGGVSLLAILSFATYKTYAISTSYFNQPCSPLIGGVYEMLKDPYKIYLFIIVFLIILIFGFRGLGIKGRKFVSELLCAIFLIGNIFFGYHVTEWEIRIQNKYYDGVEPVFAQLQLREDLPIYFLADEEHYRFSSNGKYLQYMLYDRPIMVIDDLEEIKGLGEIFLLTNPINGNVGKKYEALASAKYLKVYKLEV